MTFLGSGIPSAVHYSDHDTVAGFMAKGGRMVDDPGLVVQIVRQGANLAQIHEHTNHVFIMLEGEATMVTGGSLVDAKQTGPGQTRGASIEGGESRHLSKGDVITIPSKTPHWWKEVPTGTIAYYSINIYSRERDSREPGH